MLESSDIFERFFLQLDKFAQNEPAVIAIVLVGSHARGEARPDSDVDLVIIAASDHQFLQKTQWIDQFGAVQKSDLEDFGLVQSLRVYYEIGGEKQNLEVEFGFTTLAWLAEDQRKITGNILKNGYRVIHDPRGKIAEFLAFQ